VDVDRKTLEIQRPDAVADELSRQALQTIAHRGLASAKPPRERPRTRQDGKACETQDDGVPNEVL
jgi:hypothetical protein